MTMARVHLVLILCIHLSTCCASYVILKNYPLPSYEDEDSIPSKCQPLTIPICQSLGYNSTRLPQLMYLKNTRESEIVRYLQLFEGEKCWNELVFFVCTMFNPVCFKNHPQRVLPCKSVCQNVQRKCGKTMEKLQIVWPTELSCNQLPDYETKVCIKPKSIVMRKRYVDPEPVVKPETKCAPCTHKNKLKRFKQFKRADYAIQGQYISKTVTANGSLKLRFKVKKVFKRGSNPMTKNKMINLWSTSPCLCPRLEYEQKYIILGHEHPHRSRFYLDGSTIIVMKTHQRKMIMKRWKGKYDDIKRLKERELIMQNYDQPFLHNVVRENKHVPASSK